MYVPHVETRKKFWISLCRLEKKTHKSDQTSDMRAASLGILFERENMTPRYHFTPGLWPSIVERCWPSTTVTVFSVPLTDALSHCKPYHLHQWIQKQQNLIDWSFDNLSVIAVQLMIRYLNLEPSITSVNAMSLQQLPASYSIVTTKVIKHKQEASAREKSRTTRSLDSARSDYTLHSAVSLQETLNVVKCC